MKKQPRLIALISLSLLGWFLISAAGCSKGPSPIEPTTNNYSRNSVECTTDTDHDGKVNCDDDDIDGDGVPNSSDNDEDGDGCDNAHDQAPLNPAAGCNSGGDGAGHDDVADSCKDSGEWVTIAADGTSTGVNLASCLKTRTFEDKVNVKVFWCADHKDALIIHGNTISVMSFAQGMGDMGAFANLHDGCANYKASVYVVRDGKETKLNWGLPAFAPINLGINDMDPLDATRVTDIQPLAGRVNISYANTNNNLGDGGLTHVFALSDTQAGSNVYGVAFTYQFNRREVGTYK